MLLADSEVEAGDDSKFALATPPSERGNVPDRRLVFSNALVRSIQNLTLHEKQIIALALAGISTKDEAWIAQAQRYGFHVQITAAEFSQAFGLDLKGAGYRVLMSASEKLQSRRVEIPRTDSRVPWVVSWFDKAAYHYNEGFVELVFHRDVASHLVGLRQEFNSYLLRLVLSIESIHAWRLLEVVNSWSNTGKAILDPADLMRVIEAPGWMADKFAEFKFRVLEPARLEICKLGIPLAISYVRDKAKRGRPVKQVVLSFPKGLDAKAAAPIKGASTVEDGFGDPQPPATGEVTLNPGFDETAPA